MINWEANSDWSVTPVPKGQPGSWVQSDYLNGNIHIYGITMTIGIIIAIAFSGYKFYRRQLGGLEWLALGSLIIVPVSLFGASFFGKLNADGIGKNANNANFWELFAFWQGGMAIHGGVYAGTFAGLITFGLIGRKTKVSLWAYTDAIIPNILLGQGIGRWGNFFNHEVTGAPVGKAGEVLTWLPKWILNNTQMTYNGPDQTIGKVFVQAGQNYQMAPIFLYESFWLVIAWIVITFVVPNIGRWFGKKPWKIHPESYQINWKTSFAYYFTRKEKYLENSYIDIWDKAYALKKDEVQEQEFVKDWKYLNSARTKHSNQLKELKNTHLTAQSTRDEKQQLKNDYHQALKTNFSTYNRLLIKWNMGILLCRMHNPDGYAVTKTGVEMGFYFFAWNIIRFSLELQRPDDHLFVMYEKTLSLTLIMTTAILGLFIVGLCQFVVPNLFRAPFYKYEKPFTCVVDAETVVSNSKTSKLKKDNVAVTDEKNKLKQELKKQKALEKLEKINKKNMNN